VQCAARCGVDERGDAVIGRPDKDEGPTVAAAGLQGDQANAPRGAASFCSTSGLAAEINREHKLACAHAGVAIEHARLAGALLLQVKDALPHGQFLPWIEENIAVTPRQAQRYMAAALGKPMPVRAIKSDTRVANDRTWEERLAQHHVELDPGERTFAFYKYPVGPVEIAFFTIEPSAEHPGYFFISKVECQRSDGDRDGAGRVDFLTRPVREDAVGLVLHHMLGPLAMDATELQRWFESSKSSEPTEPVQVAWGARFN
jgi:hypothetical protein